MVLITLATEDALSEAVGLRLIAESALSGLECRCLRKDGFGYLKAGVHKWQQMAHRQVVFVLTDLDRQPCPLALKDTWFGKTPLPPQLVFRIAVRTIESWVLADHEALRMLLGKKPKFPDNPDALAQPKDYLLKLARQAPREVREDLAVMKGAVASQGIGYNSRMSDWVRTQWSPERAAERSPSLRRARAGIARLNMLLPG